MKKKIGRLFKIYIVDALSFMAMGLFFHLIMKRLGWVKDGDMKLQN